MTRTIKPPIPLWELQGDDEIELDIHGHGRIRHVFEKTAVDAVKMAVAAGRPLLVFGEPGVGKSQLARAVAEALGYEWVSRTLDSCTEPHELLYEFDAVARLARAQLEGAVHMALPRHSPSDESDASGESNAFDDRSELLRRELVEELAMERFVSPGPLWRTMAWTDACVQEGVVRRLERGNGLARPAADKRPDSDVSGVVLLLDEIDKTEPSVPNALLEALGAGEFRVPGRGDPVVRDPRCQSIVMIASNRDRPLPDAFVRRCVVLHLTLPENPDALVKRAQRHFGDRAPHRDILLAAAERLHRAREQAQEHRLAPPGQAEYLDLIRAILNWREDNASQIDLIERLGAYVLRKSPELPLVAQRAELTTAD